MNVEIIEYKDKDLERFRGFYLKREKKMNRIFYIFKQKNIRRIWEAGIVGILGIHVVQNSKWTLERNAMLAVKLVIWSASLSLAWFRKTSMKYEQEIKNNIESELKEIQVYEKSKVWLIEEQGKLLGTIALKFEDGEGKIGYLSGVNHKIRLQLLQHASKFCKQQNIQVISKWQHDTLDSKWSESLLLNKQLL